jgi:hypothetical protein
MTEPDDIDDILREAGSRWRAGQPTPAGPDLEKLAHQRRTTAWVPLAAIAGVIAVVAAIAIPLSLRSSGSGDNGLPAGPSPTSIDEWLLPADSGAGVPVRATGAFFRAGSGPILLCGSVAATADLPTSSAGCDAIAVPVTGVDPGLLIHTTTTGQAFSDRKSVGGRYHQGTLAVQSVRTAPDYPGAANIEPAVPCAAPNGGWPLGYGLPADDHGDSTNALIAHVRSEPGKYVDIWEAHPSGIGSAENSYQPPIMVYVVGTTGDVAKARQDLAAIYGGNLCVHKVRYSQQDLTTMADRLRAINATPVAADVGVIEDRVKVRVIALDPTTVAALGIVPTDAIEIEQPLLLPA